MFHFCVSTLTYHGNFIFWSYLSFLQASCTCIYATLSQDLEKSSFKFFKKNNWTLSLLLLVEVLLSDNFNLYQGNIKLTYTVCFHMYIQVADVNVGCFPWSWSSLPTWMVSLTCRCGFWLGLPAPWKPPRDLFLINVHLIAQTCYYLLHIKLTHICYLHSTMWWYLFSTWHVHILLPLCLAGDSVFLHSHNLFLFTSPA